MFVKLNLIVICAVILNFGECDSCDDVFKCVSNWVATILSPNSNATKATTVNIANFSISNNSVNSNFLGEVSHFLQGHFPSLISESFLKIPSINVFENKFQINIQTFKINETKPDVKVVTENATAKIELVENNYDVNSLHKMQNVALPLQNSSTRNNVDEYNRSLFADVKLDNKKNLTVGKETPHFYLNVTKTSNKDTIHTMTEATETETFLRNNIDEYNLSLFGNRKLNEMISMAENKKTSLNFNNDEEHVLQTTENQMTKTSDKDTMQTMTEATETETFIRNNIDEYILGFFADKKLENEVILMAENKTTILNFNIDDYDVLQTTENQINAETTTVQNEVFENNGINTKINTQFNHDNENSNNIDYTYDFFTNNNEMYPENLETENLTDYLDIDYTDFYKDTTNENVEYTTAVYIPTTTEAVKIILEQKPVDGIDSVYPWIATVFLMNGDSKQFEYVCDGSLVSARVVLTAARCVIKAYATVDASNTLVILGKKSLQNMGPNEIVSRVNSIKIHDKYISSENTVENDLAILVLAEPVTFNANVKPAPLRVDNQSVPIATATTGWQFSGPLQPLYLELQSEESCMKDTHSKNIICATLGDSESTCSSYGGLLVQKLNDNNWHFKGISSGAPTSEGVCFNKNLKFTKIESFIEWIMKIVHQHI